MILITITFLINLAYQVLLSSVSYLKKFSILWDFNSCAHWVSAAFTSRKLKVANNTYK